MDEMRGCDTAVIHVGLDGLLFDGRPNEEPRVCGDVLIEIGAAMALYGRNFILLVEEGVTLPSNLQGFCECRYSGGQLDIPATFKLFKRFNDFRKSRFAHLWRSPSAPVTSRRTCFNTRASVLRPCRELN